MGSLCIGGYFGKVSEMPDAAIKLFGKTIPLPLPVSHEEEGGGDDIIANKGSPTKEITTETKDKDRETEPENGDPLTSPPAHEHDQENSPEKDANADEQHSDSGEKLLKKPDKVLPCPRCNSMDTKFCYYNNYNVNQPRHFCKNCQRYWTAGGTMRNVPVGAGRRKSKNSVHYPTLKPSGTVLSFGSNAHLGESMALALDLGEKNMMNCNPVEEKSAGFSIEEGNAANLQGFAPHFVWPCPWTPPPFYPSSAYWGCSNLGGPWISLQPGPNSPTLGKHSRDGHVLTKLGNNNSNKQSNLWIPKTLRIDDLEGAAKSSIWATMGFKNGKDDCGGIFKDFNNLKVKANSQVLFANPAALSRSRNFQESC